MGVKVGDIVKILPFDDDDWIGVPRVNEEMRKCVGEIHVVTHVNSISVIIDDEYNYHWPYSVLEALSIDEGDERYTPYFYDAKRYVEVHFDFDQERWVDDKGNRYSSFQVGLLKKTDYVLQFPIFGVGERGDTVSAVRFKNKVYLDHCYLPMTGRIDVEQESLSF